MKPFTNFPYLRQAFTEGERWPVSESRIASALAAGLITAEQAQTFPHPGAVGSHLENLERNEGFKGFNQKRRQRNHLRDGPAEAKSLNGDAVFPSIIRTKYEHCSRVNFPSVLPYRILLCSLTIHAA